MIVVVDVGLGNLRSVERALLAAGAKDVVIDCDPDVVRKADMLVVPGQGGFRDCATALGADLGEAIVERIRAGTKYLGICLGMQVLFESSDEAPGCSGLGIFAGHVRRLTPHGREHKVPHTGWNTVHPVLGRGRGASPLPSAPTYFYFVHSFVAEPTDAALVCGTTEHGGDTFASAVVKDNVFACQFHPEKSQLEGLALLRRFL